MSSAAPQIIRAAIEGAPTRAATLLANLTKGPGVTTLPSLAAINMTFSPRGHPGPRYLLRENFPRLQYSNPEVKFNITRDPITSSTPSISLTFKDGSTKEIEVGKARSSELLSRILQASKEA